jgi:hypothetical protein
VKVLAVDPGGTTGLALWVDTKNPETFRAWEVTGQMEAIEVVRAGIVEYGVRAVVCESFRISAGTLKKTQEGSLMAIEIIGALRWICHQEEIPFILQAPAEAAAFVTPNKLKLLGWWTRGSDHARSATKHLVLYLVSQRLIDPHRVIG